MLCSVITINLYISKSGELFASLFADGACKCCSWPASAIHGDKSQQERDWVLNGETVCRAAISLSTWF